MPSPAIESLRRSIRGRVVTPSDASYDEARRVWNGMIDRRPLAIVRAASIDDIAPTVRFARDNGLLLAVRGGGHNVAGNGTVDDGIVLGLGDLRDVRVDAGRATVTVAPGATLADVDRATEPAGLIVPLGVVSGTGVAGLTLGGGFGWLTRQHGLTIDSLLSADVVTADGERVHAAADENAELFWGLRGGGGNFGVVTSFTFEARRLGPEVFAGNLVYGRASWPEALRAYAEWTAELRPEITSICTFIVPPPDWELGDEAVLVIGFTWTGGDDRAARELVGRLTSAAVPDAQDVGYKRWVEWQSQADGAFPRGSRAYWKNVAFDDLDDTAVTAILDACADLSPGSAADIHHMGGRFAEVPEDATAFPDRSARYWLNVYGFWQEPAQDTDRIAWTRDFHSAMTAVAKPAEYVNFLGHDSGVDPRAQALAAYGAAKLERLIALKRRYDPANLFRLNHNIPID
jgi:FAD/FMN-containing dehydrogenase